MKIVSMKKIKAEQYDVLFDNGTTLTMCEDVILNNNILNKEIDDVLLSKVLEDNEISKIEYESIKYIERKLRSVKEMIVFLNAKTDNEDAIVKIINRLLNLKLLDDRVFACSFAKDKYNISKVGIEKIIKELENHNIDQKFITDAVSFITDDDQLIRIDKIVTRYVTSNKKDPYIKLKNKIYLNLVTKGYPKHLIYEVINTIKIDNEKAVKKQYEKLYKKYASKYSGEELEKVISLGLKKNGFNNEDIKKLGI